MMLFKFYKEVLKQNRKNYLWACGIGVAVWSLMFLIQEASRGRAVPSFQSIFLSWMFILVGAFVCMLLFSLFQYSDYKEEINEGKYING